MSGADIKRIRDGLGLTQAALAAKLGVHTLTVARWEQGVRGKRRALGGPVVQLLKKIWDEEKKVPFPS